MYYRNIFGSSSKVFSNLRTFSECLATFVRPSDKFWRIFGHSKWFESRSISTNSRILQPYNIRVAHKPTTTLRQLLTNDKDRDEPNNRQGALYKIKCSDCQASYIIGETGRNLNTRLTEHKRATKNGDANNHIAVHHQLTNHNIDWDSAQCLTYSTNY